MYRLIRLALAASGAMLMVTAAALPIATKNDTPVRAAIGGPVIIGGDDMTDHGSVDGDGNLLQGWLYIQRALENLAPNVTRSNDDTVAALGSSASSATEEDAGAAIGLAAAKVGLTATYHDGGVAIQEFFDDLASGAERPAIIYVAGDGASNDIEDQDEIDALTANAAAINTFVNEGGGLLSHGSEFGWLQALIPGIIVVDVGGGDLYFTDEGLEALPGLVVEDINAGPWHNYFSGDFGGLDVLVRSSTTSTCDTGEPGFAAQIQEEECVDAPVIIGGAQVSIIGGDEEDPTATPCIPAIPGYRCDGKPGSSAGTPVSPTVAPTQQPTTAPPPAAATATPSGGTAGAGGRPGITGPDTGDGTTSGGGGTPVIAIALLAGAGIALIGAGTRGIRRSR